jgi:hypothetical protein
MKTLPRQQSTWPAIAIRFVLPALITLVLFVAPGHGAPSLPPGFAQPPGPGNSLTKPGWRWGPASSGCPLPPASAFSWQTNLRKYLETWPTPGSTATEAWPEYIPEDGEDLG